MSGSVRIIGAGISGLTLALRLADAGRDVEVCEAEPFLGGLSAPTRVADVDVDRFYHCVLPGDSRLLALFERIGIAGAVQWNRTRTGFFVEDRLLEMTTTADFLRFPALQPFDRMRLAWTIVYTSYLARGSDLDGVGLVDYLRGLGGNRVYERIWRPLLEGKLGPDHERFAASFIWGTIRRMMSARRSSRRAESLGALRGGYGVALRALRRAVEERGGRVLVPCRIEALRSEGRGRFSARTPTEWLEARPTVLCVPEPVGRELLGALELPGADPTDVDYLGVICEVLVLRRSLTPYYVLNPAAAGLPFTGVIETSNLAGTEAFGDRSVVYLPRYRAQHHGDWAIDDDTVHAENFQGLRRIVPDLHEDDLRGWAVHRARFVQPIHHLHYGRQIPPVRISSGLARLNTAQIHPWPVFNDEVVGLVDRNLAQVIETLDEEGAA